MTDEFMASPSPQGTLLSRQLLMLLLGTLFGIILVKAHIADWFRIQEMFHFAGWHMYGVILSAIAVAMASVQLLMRTPHRTLDGAPLRISAKTADRGQIYGGLLFGLGWALTGACPGPLYAQLGALGLPAAVSLLSALCGAWLYGRLKPYLPH